MAKKFEKKFYGDNSVGSEQILIEQGQAIKVLDSTGAEVSLIELGSSDEVKVKGAQVSLKADLDQEIIDRAAGDASTLSSAEAYTDGEISTLSASVSASISAEEAARIAADASTLASANSYTDQEVLAEETARIAADQSLQSQIDAISGGGSGSLSAIQSELDATQVGAGLNASGNYIPHAGNYIQAVTSIHGATVELDTQLKVVADDLAQEIIDRGAADDLKVNKAGDTMSGALIVDEASFATSTLSSTSLAFAGSDYSTNVGAVDGFAITYSDPAGDIVIGTEVYDGVVSLNYASNGTTYDGSVVIETSTGIVFQKTDVINQVQGTATLELGQLSFIYDDLNSGIVSNANYNAGSITVQSDDGSGQSLFQVLPNEPVNNAAFDGSAPAPTLDTHLTSKKYVDDSINAVSSGAIAQEIADRIAGDANLQSQINNVLSNVDAGALDSLTEIVSAFQAADASLNGAITALSTGLSADIDAEEAARIAADAALQGEIDAEEVARAAADTTLQNNINAEASARQSADDALDVRVDVLESVTNKKQKFAMSNQQISITLAHAPIAGSLMIFVDQVPMHESLDSGASDDWSVSGTTVTFINDYSATGNKKMQANDTVYVKYQYLA